MENAQNQNAQNQNANNATVAAAGTQIVAQAEATKKLVLDGWLKVGGAILAGVAVGVGATLGTQAFRNRGKDSSTTSAQ